MPESTQHIITALALSVIMILAAGCTGWGEDGPANPEEETDGNGEAQADEGPEDEDRKNEEVDGADDTEADAALADEEKEDDVRDPPEEDTENAEPESDGTDETEEAIDETPDEDETETDETDEASEESDEGDDTDSSDDSDTNEELSESDKEDETNDDDDDHELSENRIEIEYTGPWEATVSESGSQRIVEGTGSEVIELDAGVNNPWATVTKQDRSQDRLTMRLIIGGEVVDEKYDETEIGVVGVDYIGSSTRIGTQQLQAA